MKRKHTYLEYKYPNSPWVKYDYTADDAWAEIQYIRMQSEYPGAEYRKEKR